MCHGSYLAEDHYVIRLIEIACIDNNILTVTGCCLILLPAKPARRSRARRRRVSQSG